MISTSHSTSSCNVTTHERSSLDVVHDAVSHLSIPLKFTTINHNIIHHILVLPKVLALAAPKLRLDNKRTTIDRVDDREPAGESVVGPGTRIPEGLTASGKRVVAGEDVEVGDLLDAAAVGVARDGADVEDAQTGLVVGLVGEAVVDELIVVDGAGGGLVVAGVLGGFEVGDVPDVCGWVAVLGDGVGVGFGAVVDLALVELVVHDKVGLPVGVEDPALVGVGRALVGCAGDDGGGVEALLVGDVVDGQGVFVVAVADVTAVVLLVGSTVDNALGIVDVAVLGRTALLVGLGDVVDVNEDETTGAGVIAASTATATDGNSVALLLVGDNVVRAASNALALSEVVEPSSEVLRRVEGLGLLGVQLQELLEVEDLHSVVCTLGSDEEVVAKRLHLVPDDRRGLSGKAAKVLKLTLLGDFCESSAVGLTNGNKLAALVCPTPRTRSLRDRRRVAKLLVCLEVVHVLSGVSRPVSNLPAI